MSRDISSQTAPIRHRRNPEVSAGEISAPDARVPESAVGARKRIQGRQSGDGRDHGGRERIGPRERLVLGAIIEIYIATGQPVASQAVARHFEKFDKKDSLSSATIRNVMAALGEGGLLEQPHTSAGRIPTAKAFRHYVERLTSAGNGGQASSAVATSGSGYGAGPYAAPMGSSLSVAGLSEERREQIDENFRGVQSRQQYLERTSQVLAMVSSGLGIALAAEAEQPVLEHIHFSRLSAGRVLAVLVTKAGTVQDRVLAVDRDLPLVELETAARYLNENFRGWVLERIRAELSRRIEAERREVDRVQQALRHTLDHLCRKGALDASQVGPAIYVDGMANLLLSELDRERLRQLLVALDAKQRLVALLNAYVDARQREVRVVVGLEDAGSGMTAPGMQDLVLIGTPVRQAGANVGTVAVIAPTRIQYQEMIQSVSYIARWSERILEGVGE